MRKVIILRGLPASGKSTWARQVLADNPGGFKRISKDALRAMLDGGKWGNANEKFVLDARDALILQALAGGFHVIVDDTNLAGKHRERIAQLVKGQAAVEVRDFTDVPLEECIRRDQARPDYVGETVIREMYNRFLRPPAPVLAVDPSLPRAIICDLDGTLALFGDANPYDRDFLADALNAPVKATIDAFGAAAGLIITSGRSAKHRAQTEEWLRLHAVAHDLLLMRAEGDGRKDVVVKREMYEGHIRGKWAVLLVLDDRSCVVELWRNTLGLACFQVADGDF